MPPRAFYDIENFDYDNPLYGVEEIRKTNPQRYEMEQLTGIVHIDEENTGIVGFKDLSNDEFWIRGHMPEFPLMPGVLMCEAAAQIASFYAVKENLLDGDFIGFGGINNVQFRKSVFPGNRLIIALQAKKIRPNRRAEFFFQGFVDGDMVVNGEIVGVPIKQN